MNRENTNLEAVPDDASAIEAVGDTAATLVSQGARLIRDHHKLAKKGTLTLKSLADVIFRLRQCFEDADGRPDLTGTSHAYREAAARMYEKAGVPADSAHNTQNSARYHVNQLLHDYAREHNFSDADYAHYGINKKSRKERAADFRAKTRQEALDGRAAKAAAASATSLPEIPEGAIQPSLGEIMGAGKDAEPKDVAESISRRLREVSDIAADAESALTRLKAADRKKLKKVLDDADETNAVLRGYL